MALSMSRLSRRLSDFYDDYRTVLLSKKYYCYRLKTTKRVNLICDIILAVAASSTFAAWTQVSQKFAVVQHLAPWASGAVALLAIVKPFIGYDKEIERLSKLVAHYSELFEHMRRLIADVYIDQAMSAAIEWQAQSMQSSMVKLSSSEDLTFHRKRLEALQAEVLEELPPQSFWYPHEKDEAKHSEKADSDYNQASACDRPTAKGSAEPTLVAVGA